MRFRTAVGFWVGLWAGAVLVALVALAIDSSYSAQELVGGGHRLRAGAILAYTAIGGIVGGILGAILSQKSPERV